MALFNECMQWCAHIVLDTADIVRDGDFSPIAWNRAGSKTFLTGFFLIAVFDTGSSRHTVGPDFSKAFLLL
jgi:hypothetical protein